MNYSDRSVVTHLKSSFYVTFYPKLVFLRFFVRGKEIHHRQVVVNFSRGTKLHDWVYDDNDDDDGDNINNTNPGQTIDCAGKYSDEKKFQEEQRYLL